MEENSDSLVYADFSHQGRLDDQAQRYYIGNFFKVTSRKGRKGVEERKRKETYEKWEEVRRRNWIQIVYLFVEIFVYNYNKKSGTGNSSLVELSGCCLLQF